jgi:hypothetical protein
VSTTKRSDATKDSEETWDDPTVEREAGVEVSPELSAAFKRLRKRGVLGKTQNLSDERRASLARHTLGGKLEAEREGEVSTVELLSIGLSAVFGPKPERDVATGRLSAILSRKAMKADKDDSK